MPWNMFLTVPRQAGNLMLCMCMWEEKKENSSGGDGKAISCLSLLAVLTTNFGDM